MTHLKCGGRLTREVIWVEGRVVLIHQTARLRKAPGYEVVLRCGGCGGVGLEA